MGNSSFNCFRNVDRSPTSKKLPKGTHENASIITLKIWKQLLGLPNKSHLISFSIPPGITHKSFRTLDKDLARSYPQSSYFQNEQNMAIFSNLLRKLCIYFPKTGYTQGMNFLAGFFLLSGMAEEEAFTICVKVLTNSQLMCIGLYEDFFPLNRFSCALVWAYLEEIEPNIKKKIGGFNITDQWWIFQWFMTFFVYSFPFEIIPQIWTFIFLKKELVFVRLGIAFVLSLWPYIQLCQNQFDFVTLTTQLKQYQKFNSKLKIQQILHKADQISNQQIKSLISRTQGLQKNKYAYYFNLSQSERKSKFMQIHSKLLEDRQQFLKNPQGYNYSRDQNQISMLDIIELSQSRLMYHSYTQKRPEQVHVQENKKMWSSDLHKMPQSLHANVEMQNKQKQQQHKETHQQNKAENQYIFKKTTQIDVIDIGRNAIESKQKQTEREMEMERKL